MGRHTELYTKVGRDAVVDYIRSNPGAKLPDIAAAIGAGKSAVKHHLFWASNYGLIRLQGFARGAKWYPVQDHCQLQQFGPNASNAPYQSQLPTVNLISGKKWDSPGISITFRSGYRYTKQDAPLERFAVDVKPGCGVISQDNPRIASLATRS